MKFLKSSFWLHSIFFTFMQRFSMFFFGAFSFIILVRGFSTEDNGLWALYLTTLTLIESVKQGLLRNPTIKFLNIPDYVTRKNEVQSSSLVINIAFSLLAIMVLQLGAGGIANLLNSQDLVPLLKWSFLFIIILIPFSHCEVMLQANYQFSKIFWAYFVRQAIFFSGIVYMFFFWRSQFTPMNMMLLQVFSLGVGAVILFFLSRPILTRRFHYDAGIIRHMFSFGKYIFGTNLFSNISRSFDHYITASILGPVVGKTYVSYYNTVARINNMIDMPSLAAADVLFPKNAEAAETDGIAKVKYYFERMIGIILALVVPISLVIFIFPKLVIYTLAGSKYAGAIPILQLTILFSLVRPLSYQYGSTLDAIGKPQVNFWSNVVFMFINLGLNYVFLLKFQGIGAAYATAVNSVITFILMIAILKKYINVELGNVWRYMLQSYRDVFKIGKKLITRGRQ